MAGGCLAGPALPVSALTYNAHRIHYDRDYARDAEGYPGLLTHGPLQALAMAEAVHAAQSSVEESRDQEFAYRLESPLFDHQGMIVRAVTQETASMTSVRDIYGRRTASGTLRYSGQLWQIHAPANGRSPGRPSGGRVSSLLTGNTFTRGLTILPVRGGLAARSSGPPRCDRGQVRAGLRHCPTVPRTERRTAPGYARRARRQARYPDP